MSGLPVFNQWTPVDGCSSEAGGAQRYVAFFRSRRGHQCECACASVADAVAIRVAITLMVNGRGFFNVGSPPDFSVSGNAITWLSTIYSVSPGDDVVAIYFYIGAV